MTRGVALTAIVLGLALGSSLDGAPAARGQEAAVEERLESLEQQLVRQRTQRLYGQACAPCHGVHGDGQGPAARELDPKPRDLTRGSFKFRTTPSGDMPTDADLLRTVSEGVPGTTMPAWKRLLSLRQRRALVQYIKTFAVEDFAAAEMPDEPLRLPPAPPVTPASIARGEQLYEQLKCWECHGHSGRGDGPSAAMLKDDRGRPIRVQDFTKGVYKSGQRQGDLLRTFLTGLDGAPMPSFADSISVEEGWGLVHYVHSLARPKNLWYYLFLDTGELFPGR